MMQDAYKTLQYAQKALKSLESLDDTDFEKVVQILATCGGNILATGVGKSGYIAMKCAATLSSLGFPATFLDATNALHGDVGFLRDGDVLLVLSNSGKTVELDKLVRHIKKHYNIQIIVVSGSTQGDLQKVADVVLTYTVEEEGAAITHAPMASTTASLVICDMLASALCVQKEVTLGDFARFHPAGSIGLQTMFVKEVMKTGDALPFVLKDDSFKKVVQTINAKKLGFVIVCEESDVCGIVTDGDIRRFLESSNTLDVTAQDIMTPHPKMIRPDQTLHEALVLLEKHKITSVVVSEDTKTAIGILHIHDILSS